MIVVMIGGIKVNYAQRKTYWKVIDGLAGGAGFP